MTQTSPQPRKRHAAGRLSDPTKTGRRTGTVRFAAYWKVQRWEERSLTWKDVQQAHDTEAAAWAAADKLPGQTRLMRIAPEGRAPVTR